MKKNYFSTMLLAAMALTAGLTSCNNDDEMGGMSTKGNQVLEIKLPSNVTTRGVEDPVAGGTTTFSTLSDVTVFLMNGSSVVDTDVFSNTEITAKKKRIEQVASTVNRVILVANKGTESISGLASEDAIKKYAFTVASQNATVGIADKTMIGVADVTAATLPEVPTADEHDYKEAIVDLKALTARIEIGTVAAGEGVKSIELVNVFINNYYADNSATTAKFHEEGNAVWATDLTRGVAASAFGAVTMTNPYTEVKYMDAANAQVTNAANSKVYAYQVFAGNLPHIIVLVKGEYEDGYHDGTNRYFLKYVTYNKYNDGTNYITSMEANTIYKMGNLTIPAKSMTNDPEPEGFDLGIHVTITPWSAINVTPEI